MKIFVPDRRSTALGGATLLWLTGALMLVLLTGCNQDASEEVAPIASAETTPIPPTPTAVDKPTPATDNPTPVIRVTPSPIAESTPTPTITPSPTPSATATRVPNPSDTPVAVPTNTPIVPTPTPTVSTNTRKPIPTPVPDTESAPPQSAVENPDDALWSDLIESLNENEQTCVRSFMGYHPDESLFDDASRLSVHFNRGSLWECLDRDTAIDLYLSSLLSSASENEGDEYLNQECARGLLAYVDFGRLISASVAEGFDNPYSEANSLLTLKIIECFVVGGDTDWVATQPAPVNLAANKSPLWRDVIGESTQAERSCIESEARVGAEDPRLSESVFDGATLPWEVAVWGCLSRETALELMWITLRDDPSIDTVGLAEEDVGCADSALSEVDLASFAAAGLIEPAIHDYAYAQGVLIAIGFCLGFVPAVTDTDDHGDSPGTATPLVFGQLVVGRGDGGSDFSIGSDDPLDIDYFSFNAEAGQTYQIDVKTGAILFFDVAVYDENENLLRGGDYFDTIAFPLIWKAPDSGTYFLAAMMVGTGNYTVSVVTVDYTDDHGDDLATATTINLGDNVTAQIGTNDDADYFKFRSEAGVAYQIDVALEQDKNIDFFIYDSDGDRVDHVLHRLIWEVADTADYYLSVRGKETGGYSVSLGLSDFVDDHGDERESATEVTVPQTIKANIGSDNDRDYFKFNAERGQGYRIELNEGSVEYLGVSLHDSVSSRDIWQEYGDVEGTSYIIWQATEAGVAYVDVGGTGIGDYTLSFALSDYKDDHPDDQPTQIKFGVPIPGFIVNDNDYDVFEFTAEAGQAYEIEAELGTLEYIGIELYSIDGVEVNDSDSAEMTWYAREAGNYFLYLSAFSPGSYTLTVSLSDYVDDHADSIDHATPITFGETVDGTIGLDGGPIWDYPRDSEGDIDYFAFVARRGQLYEIDVDHLGLSESRVFITSADSEILDSAGGDALGWEPTTGEPWLIWKAPASSTYYVALLGNGTGDYQITIDTYEHIDDHGDDNATATKIEIGVPTTGMIGLDDDLDSFKFAAEKGRAYSLDIVAGSLRSPDITLYDDDPAPLARFDQEMIWVAPSSGHYYAEVSGYRTGDYTLSIKVIDYVDDHSDDKESATAFQVGSTIKGVIGSYGDIDFFKFNAEAGKGYRTELTFEGFEYAAIGIYSSQEQPLAGSSNYGESNFARFEWIAQESGEYFISASIEYHSRLPTDYKITLQTYDLVDEHSNNIDAATFVEVSETIGGTLIDHHDTDAFQFTAELGKTYQIYLEFSNAANINVVFLGTEGTIMEHELRGDRELAITWQAPDSFDLLTENFVLVSSVDHIGAYSLTITSED